MAYADRARLEFDPAAAIAHLRAVDERMAWLIDRALPFAPDPNPLHTPFDALLEAIVYQQLSGKAAATIHGRVCALYRPRRYPKPADILATNPAKLRGAGLSRAKTLAVKDLARKALDGTVPTLRAIRTLGDDEIVERLTAIRGIGRWTVEMLLLFRLGRPDILPAADLGVQKGFKILYGKRKLPTPQQLLKHGERWRPYRSVASWYLWRACDPTA